MSNINNVDPSLNGAIISANLNAFEGARSSFFVFQVDGDALDGIVRATAKGTATTDTIPRASEYLRLNILSTSVPNSDISVQNFKRGNDTIKYAGMPTYSEGSLTIDDVVGLDTKGILYAWKALAYNDNTRKGGRMSDYKYNCTLFEYDQQYNLIRSWKMYGCWISKIQEDAFNRETDGKRKLTASLPYDRAVMDYYNTDMFVGLK